ncbi:TPA: DUF927 domain-containing protein [Clostridioides difficile]|nr:DUF927 domain-containing protein [Clostridioides difficile]HBF4815711.1 DUF927 domain-containing protein [Clostridioides difficile]HBL6721052.1 DUF927 domain-containing protein [Clostridioides difficile]
MAIKKINREKISQEIINRKQVTKTNEFNDENQKESYFIETRNYLSDGYSLYVKSLESPYRERLGNHIRTKEVTYNIDNGKYKALIEYKSIKGISEILIDRADYLNERNLMKYQSEGLDVMKRNVGFVTEYLRESESEVPMKYTHSKLGFSEYEGKLIYKLYKAIGIDSKYVGPYKIEPKGTIDEYLKMINEHVLGHTELEFALSLGISSELLAYIGEDLGLDSNIIHIVGNSTTGKSTALKLAISCFGYPSCNEESLYGTYNGTNNALIKKLGGLRGVPYALDEISMSDSNNFTKFIYSLSNGADKERLNKDSELMKKESWLTTILSNGEKSIIRSSNKNAGVQVRVIEAENFIWTKSAKHAESINKIILNNYGHLGIKFAEYLLKQSKEDLIKQYKHEKDKLSNKLRSINIYDDMTDRRCSKFTIIIQTALILKDILNIDLDIEGMIDMITNIEKESIRNRNFNESVIDYIKGYVETYRNQFDGITEATTPKVLGKITEKEDYIEVQMMKESFKYMINEGGYEDEKIVLKELKKGGYLDCEVDRYTRTRRGNEGKKIDYIVIKLDKYQEKIA